MGGRLDEAQRLLRERLGGELLSRCPDLPYVVSEWSLRSMPPAQPPGTLWRRIDSAIFNAVYQATGGTMLAALDDGRRVRVTSEDIRDLSDRLLALSYARLPATDALRDALFDLSREGSCAAMRELLSRFPLDETERALIEQVLSENERDDPSRPA